MTVNMANVQGANAAREGFAARHMSSRGVMPRPAMNMPASLSISDQAQAMHRSFKLNQVENEQMRASLPQAMVDSGGTNNDGDVIGVHAHWGFPCDSTKLWGALSGILNYEDGEFDLAINEGKVPMYSGNPTPEGPMNFTGLATMYAMLRDNIMATYNGVEQEERLTALSETLEHTINTVARGIAATVNSTVIHNGSRGDVMDFLNSRFGEYMTDSMREFFSQMNLTPSASLFDTLVEVMGRFVREASGVSVQYLTDEVTRL